MAPGTREWTAGAGPREFRAAARTHWGHVVRVLVAPDKFKFALDAASAAAAIAAGVRDARPDAEVRVCPLADGGEGSGAILARALGALPRTQIVLDPLARAHPARWWCTSDKATAVIEMAEAAGLALLGENERDPLRTTSYGVGQLIAAAAEIGCTEALVCVGGSATVDGGAGCVQALGFELLDSYGRIFDGPATGGQLPLVRELRRPASLPRMAVRVLRDVSNPLLGPNGAARVFGPQKGALPDDVEQLERGLAHWAEILRAATGRDVRYLPGGGAAGGLPAGLHAVLRAQLVQGFAEIAKYAGLREQLAGCDLCITGEGRIDGQTTGGKVVAGVAELARELGVPVVALAGAVALPEHLTLDAFAARIGLSRICVATPEGTATAAALAGAAANLRRAAAEAMVG